MPDENGSSPSRETLELSRIRLLSPILAAIGWLGLLILAEVASWSVRRHSGNWAVPPLRR